MPSNYTPNYALNQWSKSDRVLMEDFNADNAKIDGAVKAVDAKADALAASKAEVIFGVYTGDGKPEKTVTLGRKPKAVLLFAEDGRTTRDLFTYGGLALENAPVSMAGSPGLTLTEDGFTVYYHYVASSSALVTNSTNQVYHYIAFV